MSQKNVEHVRELIDAYNRRDVSFIEQRVHPDAAMVTYEAMGLGDAYTGPGGVRRYFDDAMAWESVRVEAEGVKEAEEGTVVFWGQLCATGGTSGVALEADLGWVIELHAGKVAALRVYATRREAFEAAGLLE